MFSIFTNALKQILHFKTLLYRLCNWSNFDTTLQGRYFHEPAQMIAQPYIFVTNLSRVLRKPAFCICENKHADQLRAADQRLCFRYTDSTIPLLHISEISSLKPSSVSAQPGLCRTLSETPKTCFLASRLIYFLNVVMIHVGTFIF